MTFPKPGIRHLSLRFLFKCHPSLDALAASGELEKGSQGSPRRRPWLGCGHTLLPGPGPPPPGSGPRSTQQIEGPIREPEELACSSWDSVGEGSLYFLPARMYQADEDTQTPKDCQPVTTVLTLTSLSGRFSWARRSAVHPQGSGRFQQVSCQKSTQSCHTGTHGALGSRGGGGDLASRQWGVIGTAALGGAGDPARWAATFAPSCPALSSSLRLREALWLSSARRQRALQPGFQENGVFTSSGGALSPKLP